MKKFFAALVVLLFTGLLTGCGSAENTGQKEQLTVYTSFYPLYDFAKQVGGDKIIVKNVVPAGAEPHDWEPSPQDVAEMTKADVLILSGTGMEPWAEKVLANIDQSKVTVIYGGQNIELIEGTAHEHEGEEEHGHEQEAHEAAHHEESGEAEEHDHDHGGKDPHIWLDPVNAKIMVDNIQAGLAKADEKNKAVYEANAEAYKKELDKLHEEYQKGLANAKIKEFVTSHAAFGYLAKRYGLTQVPVRGLSPESEPSPADMAEVVEVAREKNIKHIFFETLVSPKVSEVIAHEVKGETLVLNPLESLSEEEIAAGKNYLTGMRDNLKNLEIAVGAVE
ncbi:metal ABC transporter substrate-binding protein [Desulforamulus ruminis]|uniref:Periplasmic solute binding protein n=1 Tax=Desulforamulus ruminis (strain ATCC 23193 / DSM 2154 / NCIMB 8452 / DL) TaxID=696281 RepID=F6DKX1_DESRL|nr:metal ABC transporter substrate-binding protein [Desulforamulus ruminis]AEG61603.1 periplasmic solute binding protein [Desulforamulus ruminis DSM 2154]